MKLLHIVSTSFLPNILPSFTGLSSLERLVINNAIKSSIVSSITSEWSFDQILFNIFNAQNNNMWIISVIAIYGYIYYKASLIHNSKLKNIDIYDSWNKNIRDMFFILFIIFTKDVQNAL